MEQTRNLLAVRSKVCAYPRIFRLCTTSTTSIWLIVLAVFFGIFLLVACLPYRHGKKVGDQAEYAQRGTTKRQRLPFDGFCGDGSNVRSAETAANGVGC